MTYQIFIFWIKLLNKLLYLTVQDHHLKVKQTPRYFKKRRKILFDISSQIEQIIMISNNSTVQQTQKFHLKAIENRSALVDVNLEHAIKKSNVRNFIKKGSTLKNQSFDFSSQNMSGLEDHLLELKNSVSQLMRQIKNKDIQSSRYKDQTSFTFQKIKKIKEERQTRQQKIVQLQKHLERVNSKKQTACHSSKTYEHILQRMQKDKILQQLIKNEQQRQLKNLQKSSIIISAKNYSMSQLEKLSHLGLKDAQQQLQKQQTYRKNNLNCVNKQTFTKINKENKLRESQNQSDQIHEMGASDIQDADLMRLKKFLTVQVFLREFLKVKMSNLKKYYSPYERSFFEIKSKTNVRDAGSLKYQFFNFERTYNEKNMWLRYLEGQLSQVESQNKKLKQSLNKQVTEEMDLIEKLQNKEKDRNQLEFKELNQKSLNYELLWLKIQGWMKIQAKKINIQTDQKQNIQALFKKIVDEFKPKVKAQTSSEPKQENKIPKQAKQ